jgi:hypothetical protein
MFKRYYHCFVAGLSDISFDDGKSLTNLVDFRSELAAILHRDDYRLASIIFLPYDNANLIKYMSGKPDMLSNLGNFTAEEFDEQVTRLDSIIKVDDILPGYMVEVIRAWLASEKTLDMFEAEKLLTEGYFQMATTSGNKFLKSWIEFEFDMNNILVLKNALDLGVDVSQQIIGANPLSEELKTISRRKSDFKVPTEPEYAGQIFNIAGESEFLEREIKIDLAKWNWINDLVFFEYFTIDFILGYLVKLSIALRWKSLDPEIGERMLKKLVAELKENEKRQAVE